MNKQDPLVRVSVSLPASQVEYLDALTRQRHVTRSALLRDILRRLFAAQRTPNGEPA